MWLVHVLSVLSIIIMIWLIVDHIKNPNGGGGYPGN